MEQLSDTLTQRAPSGASDNRAIRTPPWERIWHQPLRGRSTLFRVARFLLAFGPALLRERMGRQGGRRRVHTRPTRCLLGSAKKEVGGYRVSRGEPRNHAAWSRVSSADRTIIASIRRWVKALFELFSIRPFGHSRTSLRCGLPSVRALRVEESSRPKGYRCRCRNRIRDRAVPRCRREGVPVAGTGRPTTGRRRGNNPQPITTTTTIATTSAPRPPPAPEPPSPLAEGTT